MPQIVIKGLSKERTAALSGAIAQEVAGIIGVPEEWIVVEHNETPFYRCGKPDSGLCTILVQWKTRPRELQKAVSQKLAELILGGGCDTVEVMYTNLDMDEFYEYKATD